MTNHIILPKRLQEARVIRRMSQGDLADKLEVTKQAISQYENGIISPKTDIILKISTVLDFPLSYFYKPYPDEIITPIFFRKRKTARKKYVDIFRVYINWIIEIYMYLETYLKLPDVNMIYKTGSHYTTDEISDAAQELRHLWGLGNGPISNLLLLLENNGFIISKTELSSEKVDACSVYFTSTQYEKRPMIFLTSSTSAVRSRRDLAHELAHQVLHSWMTKDAFEENYDTIEKEAESFASFFLMPERAMERERFAVTSANSLLVMKKRWGVSAQSILYHLHNLDMISSNLFENIKNSVYRRGWKKREPYDDEIAQEKPELIKDAIVMIVENNLKLPSEIIEDLTFPVKETADLCGTSRNYFDDGIKGKPQMYVLT